MSAFGVTLPKLRLLFLAPCNVISLERNNTNAVNNHSLLTAYVQVCIWYMYVQLHNDHALGVAYAC